MNTPDQFLWVEKYRPQNIEHTLLPERLKSKFRQFLVEKNLPNLLLAGSAGCGKTSSAIALLKQLGCSYTMINGSMEGNIDTLRNKIQSFASSMSFDGKRKYVILDEADYLTGQTQAALRNFMEKFSKNCGFILTCNYPSKIIPEIHSRCSSIEFSFDKNEKKQLMIDVFKSVSSILKQEFVEYNEKVLAEVIKKFFPDIRKILNQLQLYSAGGKIDLEALLDVDNAQFKQLVGHMKAKDLSAIRSWVIENQYDDTVLFRMLYDNLSAIVTATSIPKIILIIAEYQYKAAFVADKEINMVAALIEIVIEATFNE